MTASDTTSTTLSGIGVSPGLVAGPVARMAPPIPEPEIATLEPSRDIEKECERIALAAQQVKKGLELSAAEAKAEARTLLETTAQMAADPTLTSTAQAMVREKRLVPERAVWESAGTLATMLESLGGYMAERTRDVQDVRDRIVAVLTESPMPGIPRLPEPFVLVAADLAPADTALLDPEKVIAFITSEGGPTSHTAILARALGMPAIVGTGEEVTDALAEGDIVLVDGTKGTITINPSEDALCRARELASRVRVFNGDGATKDGHEVQLLANVGDAAGARSAAEAGALRVDHVIGLFRLWWIPEGMGADHGAYVRYDHEAMLGVVLLEAHRAGAVVIGEDLGTVEPWARDYLASRGVLGTSVLWFEKQHDGWPLQPQDYRRLALSTVSTHDLPPTAGYLADEHVELRERLGLLTEPVEQVRTEARIERDRMTARLREHGLLGDSPTERQVVEALHRYVVRTPSVLVGIALVDGVGERRAQNQPGTDQEYPNWRIPLADGAGEVVLVDDLPGNTRLGSLLSAVREEMTSQD